MNAAWKYLKKNIRDNFFYFSSNSWWIDTYSNIF